MKSNFTPGPWRRTGPNVRSGDALICYATNHHADAETPEPEKLANARLISLAPQMLLAALEKAIEHIEDIYLHDGFPAPDFVTESRSLIAKANGDPKE
jgi:hypothetical protein